MSVIKADNLRCGDVPLDEKCRQCGKLLAKRVKGELHIKYTRLFVNVKGRAQITCPFCKTVNEYIS